MKKVLVLGGTSFIGRNLVEKIIETNAYDITLFNRQETQPSLFPQTKKIKGDRSTNDINQIKNQEWHAVIDLSCYFPNVLEKTLKSINKVEKYIFISTCSVYDNEQNQSFFKDELAVTLSCNEEEKNDPTPASYGKRKAECERILQESKHPYVILRPALVFGKYDPTDRLYYWLYQVKKNKVLLLPENGERFFSTTYVMDLVSTIMSVLKQKEVFGTFNTITHPKTSIKELIQISQSIMQKENTTLCASAEFLQARSISEWTDFPLWIHGDFFTFSNRKLGTNTQIEMSNFKSCIEETIAYYQQLNWPTPRYGISEPKRKALMDEVIAIEKNS